MVRQWWVFQRPLLRDPLFVLGIALGVVGAIVQAFVDGSRGVGAAVLQPIFALGDWPRDRLDVTLVEPDALAITWAEPVTGTVREMKPVLSEDASEVVRLLTERVGQISTDDTSG